MAGATSIVGGGLQIAGQERLEQLRAGEVGGHDAEQAPALLARILNKNCRRGLI